VVAESDSAGSPIVSRGLWPENFVAKACILEGLHMYEGRFGSAACSSPSNEPNSEGQSRLNRSPGRSRKMRNKAKVSLRPDSRRVDPSVSRDSTPQRIETSVPQIAYSKWETQLICLSTVMACWLWNHVASAIRELFSDFIPPTIFLITV
jgi:hypothetical protein